jgi:hypothetical protein
MESFFLFGYIIPSLIATILVVYECYRAGFVTINDVLIGIFTIVVPVYNIFAILYCGYDYLRESNFMDKELWRKE